MRSRQRLLQIAIWNVLQDAVRENVYKNISKKLFKVCNYSERSQITRELSDLDRDIIELELSNIAELMDI